MKKRLAIITIITMLVTTTVFGESISEYVRVLTNAINVELNGKKVEGINLLYNGTTYVPLKTMTEMIGGQVSWDADTKTASVNLSEESSSKQSIIKKEKIVLDAFINPVITYEDLGVNKSDIHSIALTSENDLVSYSLLDDGIHWNITFGLGVQEEITIIMNDETVISKKIETASALAKIEETADAQVIYVPANPEEGFNFPYLLRIPASYEKEVDNLSKKYLVVDTTNSGESDLTEAYDWALDMISYRHQYSIVIANKLGYPSKLPILPRTGVNVKSDKYEYSSLYEHALDRDSVYVRELTTTDSNRRYNNLEYAMNDIDPTLYYDLDEQVAKMIDHSTKYLNSNNQNVEEKAIMIGYSASGTFTDRFTNLHPDKVKMVLSGGTVDDVMLPTSKYKNETISFPLGTSDYKAITGRDFDLDQHNSVARLIFMGKDDTNNTVGYSDGYDTFTNKQIIRLFGKEVLPRALTNIEVYGEVGGKGIFILDKGVKHSSSSDMNDYLLKFIIANVNSDIPVYPVPTKSNLETTIYK